MTAESEIFSGEWSHARPRGERIRRRQSARRLRPALCAALLCLALPGVAAPTVLTFEGISTDPIADIPDGYGGLVWHDVGGPTDNPFRIIDGATAFPAGSGYENGTVSPDYVAFNPSFAAATVRDFERFDFTGAYITAAWTEGLEVTVLGRRGGLLVASQTVVVDAFAPVVPTDFVTFNFLDIDRLEFTSACPVTTCSTVDVGTPNSGLQFAMDNFTFEVSSAPEPQLPLLLALGGVALAGSRLRARRRGDGKCCPRLPMIRS